MLYYLSTAFFVNFFTAASTLIVVSQVPFRARKPPLSTFYCTLKWWIYPFMTSAYWTAFCVAYSLSWRQQKALLGGLFCRAKRWTWELTFAPGSFPRCPRIPSPTCSAWTPALPPEPICWWTCSLTPPPLRLLMCPKTISTGTLNLFGGFYISLPILSRDTSTAVIIVSV